MDNLSAKSRDTATVHGIAPHERPALRLFEPPADAPAEGIRDEGLEPWRNAGRFGSGRDVLQQTVDGLRWFLLGWRAPQRVRRGQSRLHDPGDRHRHRLGQRLLEVIQHDHGEVEIGVALDRGSEALPGPAVTDAAIAPLLGDLPAESVRVRAPAVQADRRPARLEPGPTRD